MAFLERPSPIVCAPMAGASTPELAAAVSNAGGLGFLAAGYASAPSMAAEIVAYRALTGAPVAINLFSPQVDRTLELAPSIADYRASLESTAARHGTRPGAPGYDDDAFGAKLAHLCSAGVDAVSFTFGPVPASAVNALQEAGTSVGFTVTSAEEARQAVALGADFLVAQGCEAGGHRGTWNVSDAPNSLSTAQVTEAASTTGLPVIAAGGVEGPQSVQSLIEAGATSVAAGTLFLVCNESKAPAAHKEALLSGEFATASVTRAFSGRYARALVNDFVREHDEAAPAAYPNVHHMTRPIRTAAAAAGDPQGMALWSGTGRPGPASEAAAAVHQHLHGNH